MLDEHLKVFGLDNNFSLDELEEKYKELLKEFDPELIEDDLKLMFSEENVKIQEAFHYLREYYNEKDNVSSVKPIEKKKKSGKKKKRMFLIFLIPICVFLISFIIFFFLGSGGDIDSEGFGNNVLTLEIVKIGDDEIIKNHDDYFFYKRDKEGVYWYKCEVLEECGRIVGWVQSTGDGLKAVEKVFESAYENKPCECPDHKKERDKLENEEEITNEE